MRTIEDRQPPRISTVCHDCGGDGVRYVPTLAVMSGQPMTRVTPRTCTRCGDNDHSGMLRGFLPPV